MNKLIAALLLLFCTLPAVTAKDLPDLIVPAKINAPENSMEAFRNAWKLDNVAGVSTYVRRTADGVMICFQDPDTKRFGSDKKIHQITFSELKKLAQAKGENITLFSDVLNNLPQGKMLFVEVALYDAPWRFFDNKFLAAFMAELRDSGVNRRQIAVVSADQWALRDIRREIPDVKTFYYNKLIKTYPAKQLKDYTVTVFRTVQEKLRTNGFHGTALVLNETDLEPQEIALLKDQEYELCVWENSGSAEKLALFMADYIRVDDPEKVLRNADAIRKQRQAFKGNAGDYNLVAPYDPAKLPPAPANKRNENPYSGVNWKSVQQIHTTSHAHCAKGPALGNWLKRKPHPMKFVTLTNYHPATPTYPYNEVNKENYQILNHKHELVRNGVLVQGPFDWNKIIEEWKDELPAKSKAKFPFKLGGPKISPAVLPPGIPEAPNAEHSHFTDSARHICAPGSMYSSGMFDVRNEFLLRKKGFVPGTGQPWRNVFRKIIDQLILPEGGGITINHPHYPISASWTIPELAELLDFDHRVLGIEIFNLNSVEFADVACGWATDIWDEILGTGRQCYAFSVPDHSNFRGGHNILLVENLTQEECLKAYREGRFYCAVWGQSTSFTKISYENGIFTAEVDSPCELKIISKQGVILKKKNAVSITLDMRSRDKQKDVFIRVEAKDSIGEQLFSQAIMLK